MIGSYFKSEGFWGLFIRILLGRPPRLTWISGYSTIQYAKAIGYKGNNKKKIAFKKNIPYTANIGRRNPNKTLRQSRSSNSARQVK
jgi:hypothetical protein